MRVPFAVYADFESFIEPVSTCAPSDDESYTQRYQKHTPCSYCYYIKCFDEELFPPILRKYTITRKDVNVGGIFVRNLEADIKRIYKEFRWRKAMLTLDPQEEYPEEVNKVALCANDDKRVVREDGIHTFAHGHYKSYMVKTPLGGSSVSFGTTSNSSLTNPLLGERFVVPPSPVAK